MYEDKSKTSEMSEIKIEKQEEEDVWQQVKKTVSHQYVGGALFKTICGNR